MLVPNLNWAADLFTSDAPEPEAPQQDLDTLWPEMSASWSPEAAGCLIFGRSYGAAPEAHWTAGR